MKIDRSDSYVVGPYGRMGLGLLMGFGLIGVFGKAADNVWDD